MRHWIEKYGPRWAILLFTMLLWSGVGCLVFGADTPIVVINTTTGRQQQAQATDNALAAGGVKASGNTASSSRTTGTLLVTGGAGISGDIWGKTINVDTGGAGGIATTLMFTSKNFQGQNALATYVANDTAVITNYYFNSGTFDRYLDIAIKGQPDNTNGAGFIRFLANTKTSGSAAVEDVRIVGQSGNLLVGTTTDPSTTGGLSIAGRGFLGTIGSTFKGNVVAGVQDATAAVAGQVGEEIKSTVSAVAVAGTGTVGNVTSISLTAGDWLVSGYFTVAGGATGLTSGSTINCSIVTTTATNGTLGDTMQQQTVFALVANGLHAMSIPAKRVNISATTTYYLTEQVTFGGGSPTASGTLTATRVR